MMGSFVKLSLLSALTLSVAVLGDTLVRSADIVLSDPVGKHHFCKVFELGNGACDYDSLIDCKKELHGDSEACLPNKMGAKTSIKKQVVRSPVVKSEMSELQRSLEMFFTGEKCIPAIRLGYTITRKFDDHQYEMMGDGHATPPDHPALLKTKTFIFESIGIPGDIAIEYVETKKMKLENGFSTMVDVWKECGTVQRRRN